MIVSQMFYCLFVYIVIVWICKDTPVTNREGVRRNWGGGFVASVDLRTIEEGGRNFVVLVRTY